MRTIAIVAIIVYAVVTYFCADHIADRVAASKAVCNYANTSTTPPSEESPLMRGIAFGIYSSLDEANTRDLLVASREHPDLAPELRYQSFVSELHRHRSFKNIAAGSFKLQPLAEDPMYAKDFASFRDRYQHEHPSDHDPIE